MQEVTGRNRAERRAADLSDAGAPIGSGRRERCLVASIASAIPHVEAPEKGELKEGRGPAQGGVRLPSRRTNLEASGGLQ